MSKENKNIKFIFIINDAERRALHFISRYKITKRGHATISFDTTKDKQIQLKGPEPQKQETTQKKNTKTKNKFKNFVHICNPLFDKKILSIYLIRCQL